jgi:predicted nucleotidyltransferase
MSANLDTLERVANRLGALRWEVVFVGGAVSDLLISDPGAPPPRMTGDIDAVVGVTSLPDYHEFSRKLKAAGFVEDRSPDAPVCRWLVDGTKVDLMPSDASVLGFSNRWYTDTLRHARTTRLPGGTEVRVITGPYFIATKLEAFSGRTCPRSSGPFSGTSASSTAFRDTCRPTRPARNAWESCSTG